MRSVCSSVSWRAMRRASAELISPAWASAAQRVPSPARRLALAGRGAPSAAAGRAVRELEAMGVRVRVLAADVSREADVKRMVASAVERFGRLDLMVNCAGNLPAGKPVVDLAESEWRSLLDVHYTGTFLCCREAMDRIREAGGAIVNMSSSYAFKGRPNGADYSAAKAGIFGLTRVLASELAPRATANALAPGPIDTPRWRAGLSEEQLAAKRARRASQDL